MTKSKKTSGKTETSSWTAPLPSWADKLRAGSALALTWLEPKQSRRVQRAWLDAWTHVPYDEAFLAAGSARIQRSIPLATGPRRSRRLSGTPSDLVLVFDPEAPEHVFASFSDVMPPQLWGSARPEHLREDLAVYLSEAPTSCARLPRVVRLVKPLGEQTREVIDASIERHEPWLDDAAWGSMHVEDPWPSGATLPMVSQAALRERSLRDTPSRFASRSYRSLWSRSVVTVEQHPFGLCAFELRYHPVPGPRAPLELLALKGFPEDLPVDVAASLIRGDSILEPQVKAALASGDHGPLDVALLTAVAPGAPATDAALWKAASKFADDADGLRTIADVAQSYEHRALLFDLYRTHLREGLEAIVRPQPGPAPHGAEESVSETAAVFVLDPLADAAAIERCLGDVGFARVSNGPWTDGVRVMGWRRPDGDALVTLTTFSSSGIAVLRVAAPDDVVQTLAARFPHRTVAALLTASRTASGSERMRAIFAIQDLLGVTGFDKAPLLARLCEELVSEDTAFRWAAAHALGSRLEAEVEAALRAAADRWPDLAPSHETIRAAREAHREGTLHDTPTDDREELARRAREAVAKGQWVRATKTLEALLAKDEIHAEGLFLRGLLFRHEGAPLWALAYAAAARAALTVEEGDDEDRKGDESELLQRIDAELPKLRAAADAVSEEERRAATPALLDWVALGRARLGAASALSKLLPLAEAPLAFAAYENDGRQAWLDRALALASDSPTLHFVSAMEDDGEAAEAALRRALELLRAHDRSPAAAAVEAMAEKLGSEATEKSVTSRLLDLVYVAQRWDEVGPLADRVLHLDRDAKSAWQMRANALTFGLRHEEALRAYDEALRELDRILGDGESLLGDDPRGAMRFNHACVLAKLGRREAALDALRRAMRFDTKWGKEALKDDYFEAYWKDEELVAVAKDKPGARWLHEEKDPAFVDRLLFRALGRGYRGEHAAAVEEATMAEELAGLIGRRDLEVRALMLEGRGMTLDGDPEAGLDCLAKALVLGRAHAAPGMLLAEVIQNRGLAQSRAGRLDEASRSYHEAVSVFRAAEGDDHPALAKIYGDLASLEDARRVSRDEVRGLLEKATGLLQRWLDAHPSGDDDQRREALVDLATLTLNECGMELRAGLTDRALGALAQATTWFERALAERAASPTPLLENALDLVQKVAAAGTEEQRIAVAELYLRLIVMAVPGTPEERRERLFWRGLRRLWKDLERGGVPGERFAGVLREAVRGQLDEGLLDISELATLPSELAKRAAQIPTFLVMSAMALETACVTGDVDRALDDLEAICVAGLAEGGEAPGDETREV